VTFKADPLYIQIYPQALLMLAPAGQCAWRFFYRRSKPHEAARQEPPGMDKTRMSVYIDGFNFYHSTLQHTHPDCRWFNLRELSSRLINSSYGEIAAAYCFSALTTWLSDRTKKHWDSDLVPVTTKLKEFCPGGLATQARR
jgi:hypothetical protein